MKGFYPRNDYECSLARRCIFLFSKGNHYANNDKGLGIVLTPPHITDLFAELAGVDKNSVVLDNCCGTGGFLISAMKRMLIDAKGDQAKEKDIKGKQLISIEFQDDIYTLLISNIPDYVLSMSIKEYGEALIKKTEFPEDTSSYPSTTKTVPLEKLFFVENGIASSQVIRSEIKENENWIPFIRPSYRQETSIDAYVNKKIVPAEKVFPAGSLYVSTNGQGSHTFSYVSTSEFVPNSDVSVLIPKREMSLQEKLFYAQCITNNRYKFSYGRKPKGLRLQAVLLPEYPPKYVTDYNIDKVVNGFSEVLNMV